MHAIEVDHLTKYYSNARGVIDLSFEVNKGEIMGFLGPNGSGKTTTMRMLTCYISPDAGTARIAGFDITAHPLDVKKRIGYLPENNPLYLDMGVIDYLKFIAALRGIAGGRLRERIRKKHWRTVSRPAGSSSIPMSTARITGGPTGSARKITTG